MARRSRWPRAWPLAGVAVALFLAAGVALGQAQTGNLFVKVLDESGAPLPGTSVQLSGIGAPLNFVSNANGEVRYLNLSPGAYKLAAALQGFTKVERTGVVVSVGRNTEISITMRLSAVEEKIVVTGESPLLDTRKVTTGSTVAKVELENIPSARDPWVVLQTVPGVQIDRVNVGGSESGQQSNYVGKGATSAQATWNVDGVNITDMGAVGASPQYYDFDSFEELQVTTGGSDAAVQTAGVQLNMVTKRGTNDVHGSGRVMITDRKTQSDNTPDELIEQTGGAAISNQIDGIQDYGFELGGPIVKDRLWLWGAYGRNQIDAITTAGYPDRTRLENYNFKLNAQPVESNSFTAYYQYGDKIKTGRNASPTRPPETAFDQSGPTKIYKLEDSQIFSADVFATVSYSRVISEFAFVTPGQSQAYVDGGGVWSGSYYNYDTSRPQTQVSATTNFFLRTGDIGHELKAGFVYRDTPVWSYSFWPQGAIGYAADYQGTDRDVMAFVRDIAHTSSQTYYSGFLSDTMTIKNLTVNLGVRYDYQTSKNEATQIPCCRWDTAAFPEVPMTALNVPAVDGVTYKDFQPRVGLTYALGKDNKTLLRASYARFADQMGSGDAVWNQIQPLYTSYLYYYWDDDGDRVVEQGEVDFDYGPLWGSYVDPANPNPTTAINRTDPDLKAGKTDEFLLSVERELLPAFAVGLTGTYRRIGNLQYAVGYNSVTGAPLTAADFECVSRTGSSAVVLPDGTVVPATVCTTRDGVPAAPGQLLTNRPGAYQTYWGVDFTATKRYANNWMARFNFTWSDWKQHGLSEGLSDPSNILPGSEEDGGTVVQGSGTGSGAKGGVYINARWQATLSAMYTFPLAFNLAASVYAREGYPIPYYYRYTGLGGANWESGKRVSISPVAQYRLDDVWNVDLGASKVVKVGGLDVTLMADCFNVFNDNAILQRQHRVRSTVGSDGAAGPIGRVAADNDILEVQSPRIFRFGVRVSF
ncbi:TonB-dependent receptor [Acidobacteria bacterium ACD]|nr:MAG: TonB-dependent receptor [Acidobacteriota bacterium]MCE7957236.1 TonB-dependent receptor [Acidobacteria bacterium ACB2]MDL1949284.1 TonB-dependent receptor [Acidobacteria bacterium ACD]